MGTHWRLIPAYANAAGGDCPPTTTDIRQGAVAGHSRRRPPFRVIAGEIERGEGSHGTLYFGASRSLVPDLKRELKTGTLRGILKSLGLTPQDIR